MSNRMQQVKQANPVFFNRESRKFFDTRKYSISGNEVTCYNVFTASNGQEMKSKAIYRIDPDTLHLTHDRTIDGWQ